MKKHAGTVLLFIVLMISRLLGDTIEAVRVFDIGPIDMGHAITQTPDRGFMITGLVVLSGDTNCTLLKTDSLGNYEWSKMIGGAQADMILSMVSTDDGGFALGGWTQGFGVDSSDLLVIKVDPAGNPLWVRTAGGTGAEFGNTLIQTYDRQYVVAGVTTSFGAGDNDFLIATFDRTGTFQWARAAGGIDSDIGHAIAQLQDSSFIAVGTSSSFASGSDILIVKFDASGTYAWARVIGGDSAEMVHSMTATADGGFAIGAYTLSWGGGNWLFMLMKFDAAGNCQWTKVLDSVKQRCFSTIQTADSGYALAGFISMAGLAYEMFLTKFDATGNYEWGHHLMGTSYDRGQCVVQCDNGGYAVVGGTETTGFDMLLALYGPTGTTCIGTPYTAPVISPDLTAMPVAAIVETITPVIGTPAVPATSVPASQTTVCEDVGVTLKGGGRIKQHVVAYTTFFQDRVKILLSASASPCTVRLYDVGGGCVYRREYTRTPHQIVVQGDIIARLPAGVYVLAVHSRDRPKECIKIIKVDGDG